DEAESLLLFVRSEQELPAQDVTVERGGRRDVPHGDGHVIDPRSPQERKVTRHCAQASVTPRSRNRLAACPASGSSPDARASERARRSRSTACPRRIAALSSVAYLRSSSAFTMVCQISAGSTGRTL